MPAITVRQPWAFAIARGHKPVENRGRPIADRWIGSTIAIHAGLTPDEVADLAQYSRQAAEDFEHLGGTANLWSPRFQVTSPSRNAMLALGAVIAVAQLVGCHIAQDPLHPALVAEGATCCRPWGNREHHGPKVTRAAWHLTLDSVWPLPRPVSVHGQQSVPWTLPPDVGRQVAEQLKEITTCSDSWSPP